MFNKKKEKLNFSYFICWFLWMVKLISFLAFLFPDIVGLDLPFEVYFFFIEHFLPIFIIVYQYK